MIIESFYKRNPNFSVLIAVPTEVLKEQWQRELAKRKLFAVCKVEIFNTIIKNEYQVDLLCVDELHLSATPCHSILFVKVRYRYVLGLTATWERLDGNEVYLEKICPPCDVITLEDALKNGWVSEFRNYKVLIDVDLTEYYQINKKFQSLFAIFSHDFKLVMQLLKDKRKAKIWAKNNGYDDKQTRGFLAAFMKLLKARKQFVMSHPKKFEIANKILDARKDKKCITFSATIKDAEQFKNRGYVLHSKQKKKENKAIIDRFNEETCSVLSTSKSADAGVDIRGLSVGIIISGDSSVTRATQRKGRCIRLEPNKVPEIFTLVIRGTNDELWFNNSNKNSSYLTIDEKQLDIVLNGGEVSTRPKKGIVDIENRF